MNCSFNIKQQSKIYIGAASEVLPEVLPAGRIIVISDAAVDRLHHALLAPFETILIGTGETIKTLTTVEMIYLRLVDMGADRQTFLLGVGGGIVTDLTGFIASTYMRGVRFGFVSTTLLGQVDASVGGKNGVNVGGYKNMVGTFTQPQFVVSDPALLRTLPDREFRAGLAEMIKMGVVADAALFEHIEQSTYATLRGDVEQLTELIRAAIGAKVAIVERDEREAGERRKLNLGHTLAHAIEKCSNTTNHGEAVAIGTAMIVRAAMRQGVLTQSEGDRIVHLFEQLGFTITTNVDMRRLMKAVAKDKKNEDGKLHVVIPTAIGVCEVRKMVAEQFAELF
ncbi:MAG: 3-dehydroquinate synthase [Alistipes sp.]